MKHSGLAAELHVEYWSFLVDAEGREGRADRDQSEQSPWMAASHAEGVSSAQPQLSQETASCAQLCPAV